MKVFSSFLFALFLSVNNTSFAETYLRFSGPLGEYITQGKSYNFSNDNAVFKADLAGNTKNAVSISVQAKGSTDDWVLQLANVEGMPLAIGKYKNAIRFPFNDNEPGISLSGAGRGCSETAGEFEVKKIIVENDTVQTFEASFTQSCDGMAAISGSIAFGQQISCEKLPIDKSNRKDLKSLKSLEKQKVAILAKLKRTEDKIVAIKNKLDCN